MSQLKIESYAELIQGKEQKQILGLIIQKFIEIERFINKTENKKTCFKTVMNSNFKAFSIAFHL
jgi:hypothetical protein